RSVAAGRRRTRTGAPSAGRVGDRLRRQPCGTSVSVGDQFSGAPAGGTALRVGTPPPTGYNPRRSWTRGSRRRWGMSAGLIAAAVLLGVGVPPAPGLFDAPEPRRDALARYGAAVW